MARDTQRAASKMGRFALLLALTLAPSVACRAGDRQLGDRATEQAEEKASQTTITSAVFEPANDAGVEEAVLAVRAEQAEYRARVTARLDKIERELTATRSKKARAEVESRRAALVGDLAAIERSTAQDWATVRLEIDRHLRLQSKH